MQQSRVFFILAYSKPVLRSRHIFWKLRLRKSEVPEPAPASTKLGRLRLQAGPAPYTKISTFELWKCKLLIHVFF